MGHSHAEASGIAHRGRLALALVLAVSVLFIEAAVALITGSLALLADAAHMLSDTFGLTMALVAIAVAQRPASDRRSFGYRRAEILAAGANGLLLLGMCVFVTWHAVPRLSDPPQLEGGFVLAAGFLGLVANLAGIMLLRPGARENLNVRGAYLEVLGDTLGSVAVMISAILVLAFGWRIADPIASLVIAAMILPRAILLLRDVIAVLLESTPKDLDPDALREHMLEVPGVIDVHDLHVWTITSGMPVMSAHVIVDDSIVDMDDAHAVLDQLSVCLADHFDVDHSTFQLEPLGHREGHSHA